MPPKIRFDGDVIKSSCSYIIKCYVINRISNDDGPYYGMMVVHNLGGGFTDFLFSPRFLGK